jgi:(p)ppGpp synthase/HD superfamily hydrolase
MSTLERAIAIAAQAHAGQTDKAGERYILHPLRVMLSMDSDLERIVAVLHDVVEDSEITLDQLRAEGFSDEALAAIDALTKPDGESRMTQPHGPRPTRWLRVKLADNSVNQDMTRIGNVTEKDLVRLEEYKRVRAFLLGP